MYNWCDFFSVFDMYEQTAVLGNCLWFSFHLLLKNCWSLLSFSEPNNQAVGPGGRITIKRQTSNCKYQTANCKQQQQTANIKLLTSNGKYQTAQCKQQQETAKIKWQISNSKHQTENITLRTTILVINQKHFCSCLSFDLTKAGPKTSNWIKLPGKQIERPNQGEDWSNQRWNKQQIFQGLHQSKIRGP